MGLATLCSALPIRLPTESCLSFFLNVAVWILFHCKLFYGFNCPCPLLIPSPCQNWICVLVYVCMLFVC